MVSRDQLVETCWDGRIVGDDAVNRCILSLRNLARGLTPEPFRIETVRGVGYCLMAEQPPDQPFDTLADPSRRGSNGKPPQTAPPRRRRPAAIVLAGLGDRAWAERESNVLRAEALDPGLRSARNLHVGLLREVGRVAEARDLNRRTIVDDPFSVDQLRTLILMTAAADGVEAAEPLMRRLAAVGSPADAATARLTVMFWWGDPRGAQLLLAVPNEQWTGFERSCLKAYLATLERPQPHRGLPPSCSAVQADWRLRMLAREGDIDGAYRELALAPRGWPMLTALYYPEMSGFRADPRFMPLAARHGLFDYWTRTGRWPDFCAARDRPYDCVAAARALGFRAASTS